MEEVTVSMVQTTNGDENYFEGIIVNVTVEALAGGESKIIIHAKGKTISMDGKKTMDSYLDESLEEIVDNASRKSRGNLNLTINPIHKGRIDYICQYNESDFEFLNRLSYLYGEPFWYTGFKAFFGEKSTLAKEPLKLSYGYHLTSLQISSKLIPARFNRYGYLVHADAEVSAQNEESVKSSSGSQRKILKRADSLFNSEGDLPVDSPFISEEELKKFVEIERARAAAEMLTISGTSTTSEVQLGRKVHINMLGKEQLEMIDEFLITGVTHEVIYRNTIGHDRLAHAAN